jgi:hypothetical protein
MLPGPCARHPRKTGAGPHYVRLAFGRPFGLSFGPCSFESGACRKVPGYTYTPSVTWGKKMPKYNPPPNWPAPPPGWTPPQGWKAPANWPPPPKGWKFWLPDEKDGSWFGRHKTLTSVGGLAALLLLFIVSVASGGDDPSPNAAATPTRDASSTATAPTPTTTPGEPEPSTKRKAEPKGSSAKFKHFTVTVRDVRRETPSEVRMLAKVCVGTSLPPDPQGDRTRISWDPWSLRARSQTVKADPSRSVFRGAFPPDKTYRVGECASGWIPFFTRGKVTKVKYANGLGDIAVWDANHLGRAPQVSTKPRAPARTAPKQEDTSPEAVYENCTELNGDYPHGVGLPGARDRTRSGTNPVTTFKESTRLYNANSGKDRDNDGIACEKL